MVQNMGYNYKMILIYDGGRYDGWQAQQGRMTIQETLEQCLFQVCAEKVKVIASGRTDAGVHAVGQTVNFHTTKKIQVTELKKKCNEQLPEDMKVKQAEEVPEKFHSRYDAIEKTYCYTIDLGEKPRVFTRRYACSVTEKLDIKAMEVAAKYFMGTHDFRSFTSEKRKEKDTIRNIKNIKFCQENQYLKIYFTGEGFLYHMVRILVGTLIEVGMNKKKPEEIPSILEAKNRYKAGFMAPAHGLMLMEVRY